MNNEISNLIRSKVDIVDIIGERIPLISRGKNFFGVCPFHEDSNPSLSVSRDKQIYKCFSCGATGNVFTFLMNYEHMDFRETLKLLGDKVGVSTGEVSVLKKSTKFDEAYSVYEFTTKYFQNNLSSSLGKEAKVYLDSRKLDDSIIKKFGIGLSLGNGNDLTNLLIGKGNNLSFLNKFGLSVDDKDIYNDRIMFPIADLSGKVVGFSGRIYKGNSSSKYVNTKETDIFKKGQLLYNYHIAKSEARINKSIIVMEGFMDVIRAASEGILNTVALLGTALTKDQIVNLKRLSNIIILCLDGDNPGINATIKIGDMLVKENLLVKVISLSDNDDPDTYILKHGGDSFKRLISNAVNFSDYKIDYLKKQVNLNSVEEKSKYINEVLTETALINDPIRVEIILKKLAKEFDIGYNTLEKRFAEINVNKEVNTMIEFKPRINKALNKYEKAAFQILYFMLNNEFAITKVMSSNIVFPNSLERVLASEISYFYTKYGYINIADFYTYVSLKEDLLNLLNKVLEYNKFDKTTEVELEEYFLVIKEYSHNQEIDRLTTLIKKEVDPIKQAEYANKIRNLRMDKR